MIGVPLIKTESPSQAGGGFRKHAYVLLPICLVLVAFCWMVTDGDFCLFDAENFGQFYDGQAASLLAGHWDVPLKSIYPEQYLSNGKAYGYFGFAPALPRMVLNHFFPAMAGNWSRMSVLVGCAATIYCSYSLLLRARRWRGTFEPLARSEKIAFSLFIVLVGLGSTTIFLGSRAFIYHEAIIWSVALALAAFDQLFAYLMNGRLSRLLAVCLLAYFCCFTRVATGCGPLVSLALIAANILTAHVPDRFTGRIPSAGIFRRLASWQKPPPLLHAAVAGITVMSVAITFIAVNHAKFGTYFDASPMQRYALLMSEPGRYERIGGKWLRLGNIPTVLLAYLSPDAITVTSTFPWVDFQWHLRKLPASHMDGCGVYTSLVTATPMFLILAITGGVLVSRAPAGAKSARRASTNPQSPAIVLLGLIAGVTPTLAFCSVDNRYLHEFMPSLIILGAFGIDAPFRIKRRALKIIVLTTLLGLALFQIYVNFSLALVYQRDVVFGVPPRARAEFRQWRHTIDTRVQSLIHHDPKVPT